mmetsp:Transcript_29543/g.49447  ORF Transcript_29543/g.49447 Transcript_29543/m.49447 type:complete len:159 (-) Transcript_29543:178-654(-)
MALAKALKRDLAQREQTKSMERQLNLKIQKPGDAVNFPRQGDSVSVHYKGYLDDGTCFDDSFARGQPIYFVLGAEQVLRGFELVLPILSRGERARITLEPDLAYGDKGYPPIIPPKSTLHFEIELLTFSSQGHAERKTREKKEKEAIRQAAKHNRTKV